MTTITTRAADALHGADDRAIAGITVLSFIGTVISFYTLYRTRGTTA